MMRLSLTVVVASAVSIVAVVVVVEGGADDGPLFDDSGGECCKKCKHRLNRSRGRSYCFFGGHQCERCYTLQRRPPKAVIDAAAATLATMSDPPDIKRHKRPFSDLSKLELNRQYINNTDSICAD